MSDEPVGDQKPPRASPDLLPSAEGSVTMLVERFRRGDPAAAERLWLQYFPRLQALARGTVARWPQGAADADDAVQSAFVAFWRKAEAGQLPTELHRDHLWRLLALITVRKAKKQLERKRAQKRGGGKVVNEASFPAEGDAGFRLDALIGDTPAQEFDLRCEEMLLALDEELRSFALLRLMGHTTQEIAEQLDCTRRKVQRKLNLVELRWRCLVESDAPERSS